MSATRLRGRTHDQCRRVVCELSVLSRADGSAQWSQDDTSVLAAVYGPRQAPQQKEDAELAVIEVVFKPRGGLQGSVDKENEVIIRSTLEAVVMLGQHPRTSITVVLQVMQEDGSVLACACNAACAALVNAGVPMRCMFACVSCVVDVMGGMLLDPDSKEEQAACATMLWGFTSSFEAQETAAATTKPQPVVGEGALLCHTWPGAASVIQQAGPKPTGSLQCDSLLDTFDLSRLACRQLAAFQRAAFLKSLGGG
ncbi:ribosomal protein S5 domain 2-type protein [Haematococcus lacustris]